MRALVLGGGGQIGIACAQALTGQGFATLATSRAGDDDKGLLAYDPFCDADGLPGSEPFDAVVWAQGANLNDSVADFDVVEHRKLYDANVLFVALSIQALLKGGRLSKGARLCVISSIWQRLARQNKFSYSVTKAALQGLVNSAAIDLGAQGILINAVLPGALDTPMTRSNLSSEQIDRIGAMTAFGRLAGIDDVGAMVAFLCAPTNTSITGQFIAVDLGFENARIV